jgi:hypothetical protein
MMRTNIIYVLTSILVVGTINLTIQFNHEIVEKNQKMAISPLFIIDLYSDLWGEVLKTSSFEIPELKSSSPGHVSFSVKSEGNFLRGIDYPDAGGQITNNFRAWDPNPAVLKWVPGNYSNVKEGDVIAFSIEFVVTAANINKIFEMTVAFDYDQSKNVALPTGIGPYAYIKVFPYNTTFNPPLRGLALNDTKDGFSIGGGIGAGGEIINVFLLNQGEGADANAVVTRDDALAYELEYKTPNAPGTYYIYFGCQIAKAGNVTAYGDIVGPGQGIADWPIGTYQARLKQVTGQKTINASPHDVRILPVVFGNFKLKLVEQNVHVNWETWNETNNFGFYVERRSENIDSYEKIGFVGGSENSTDIKKYSFIDKSIKFNSKYFYRIKQVDFDGLYAYTNDESISFEAISSLNIFPNPSSGILNIVIPKQYETGTITILDIVGKMIYKNYYTNQTLLRIEDFIKPVPGTYTVVLFNGSTKTKKNIVII